MHAKTLQGLGNTNHVKASSGYRSTQPARSSYQEAGADVGLRLSKKKGLFWNMSAWSKEAEFHEQFIFYKEANHITTPMSAEVQTLVIEETSQQYS